MLGFAALREWGSIQRGVGEEMGKGYRKRAGEGRREKYKQHMKIPLC